MFRSNHLDGQLSRVRTRTGSKGVNMAILVFSALDLIPGVLSILLQIPITAMAGDSFYIDFIGSGIWVGLLFLTTGALGIVASRTQLLGPRKRALLISTLVMSIICSTLAWFAVSMSFIYYFPELKLHGTKLNDNTWQFRPDPTFCNWGKYIDMKISLGSFSAIAGFINIFLWIMTSVAVCCPACCHEGCCCPDVEHNISVDNSLVRGDVSILKINQPCP